MTQKYINPTVHILMIQNFLKIFIGNMRTVLARIERVIAKNSDCTY